MTERFESPPGDPPNLAVEIDAQVTRGLYSNGVLVSRSTTELTLDFAYAQPHARVVVQARIILAPANARELINLLSAQLEAPTTAPLSTWQRRRRPRPPRFASGSGRKGYARHDESPKSPKSLG